MATESRSEIYCQEDVILNSAPASYINYINTTGLLVLYENLETDVKTIEWRPNDVTIDSNVDAQEPDWAVVNTVTGRARTISGDSNIRTKSIQVDVDEIKSFRVSRNSQKLTLRAGTGETICIFLFCTVNCDDFLVILRNILPTAPSKRDKFLYVVLNDIENAETMKLDKSFAELRLFPEQPSVYWNLIKNFQNRPYETAMSAFAKVSEIVYPHPGQRELDPEIHEIMRNGLDAADHNISTNIHDGYEVVIEVPKLSVRKDYPRGHPLSYTQWKDLFDPEGCLEDIDLVKLIIFRGGVCPTIRKEVWKYLLDYYKWSNSSPKQIKLLEKKIDEYYVMKLQWKSITKIQEDNFSDFRERKSLIEKDVKRTDRTLSFYAGDNNSNLNTLFNNLMTYAMYNFDLGYVQGMSDLLSPILYVMNDEVEAFWCFVGFMNKVSSNFDMDQAGMKEQLENLHTLLGFVDPEFTSYLDKHESSNMFFCFRWMLVWFKRELSMEDTMRLWEVIWTGLPCRNFHLIIAVALLDSEKTILMENNYGFTEILKYINELAEKINIEAIINRAEGIYYQIIEAPHLTDAVRLIIGLPVIGNSTCTSPEKSEDTSPDFSNIATSSVIDEDEEDNYETALANTFL